MHHLDTTGFIEVVCGPMFAGKTEELIRRVKRLHFAKQNVLVFKPSIDTRYSSEALLVSHSELTTNAIFISHSSDILKYIQLDTDAVVIDEAQFLDVGIIKVVDDLANRGLRVIVGGLDLDFKGEPFGPMPQLLAIAEYVTKLTAICSKTGKPATRTQRLINNQPAKVNDPIIVVGAAESYEPRSRKAHQIKKDE